MGVHLDCTCVGPTTEAVKPGPTVLTGLWGAATVTCYNQRRLGWWTLVLVPEGS